MAIYVFIFKFINLLFRLSGILKSVKRPTAGTKASIEPGPHFIVFLIIICFDPRYGYCTIIGYQMAYGAFVDLSFGILGL